MQFVQFSGLSPYDPRPNAPGDLSTPQFDGSQV
jgi:hypothetical protein